MKKYLFLLFIATYMVAINTYSQTPQVLWEKSLGGTKNEIPNSIQQTSDGGYIVAGFSYSNDGDVTGHHNSTSSQDFWIVKINNSGTIEWQKSLGGSDDDFATSVKQTVDGGYIVTGVSASNDGNLTVNNGNNDFWVVKLDALGTIEWQKSMGGSVDDEGFSIHQTPDRGYIIAGETHSSNGDVTLNHGGEDYWIIKLDTLGVIQWQKAYGGAMDEAANSLDLTSDGGYILAGFSLSNDGDVSGHHQNADYWIVKIDSVGNILWQKSLGGAEDDYATSIEQTTDGGYITCGYSQSFDGDATINNGGWDSWVVKLNASGIIQWQKSVGGTLNDKAYYIEQTIDGGYVMACATNSIDVDVTNNNGDKDSWIVKFDPAGNVEWQKSFGGTLTDVANAVQQISNTGYIVASASNSTDGDITSNHGFNDFWLLNFCIPSTTTINQIACDSLTLNTVTYTVSGTYFQTLTNVAGCDSVITLNLTVVNTPLMTSAASASICSGDQVDIHFSSTEVSAYLWKATSNTNVSGESLTNQTSSILNNTLGNNTGVSQNVSYTVTPTTTVGGCVGTPQIISVTVFAPVVSTINPSGALTFCEGDSVILTASLGVSYEWKYSNNGGSSYQNLSSSAQSITATIAGMYKVEVTDANGCKKNSSATVVVVNPLPLMNSVSSATICSGNTTNIILSSDIAASYSWLATDNANTTGESTIAQSSSAINDFLINNTLNEQDVIYFVTPTSAVGVCTGATQTISVMVNPLPTINNATSVTICSGDAVNLGFTSDVASSYSWIAEDNNNTTGESTILQTSSALADIIINTSSIAQTVSYTVTPLSDFGNCYGPEQVINIIVNPSPVMTNSTAVSICSGNSANISLTSNIGADYFWVADDNANTTGESITSQNTFLINDIINNSTSSPETVIYNVTPLSTDGGCYGTTQAISVTVNPLPIMTGTSSAIICSSNSPNILFVSNIASDYTWIATDNISTIGESTTLQTTNALSNTITNLTIIPQNITYTVTPTSTVGACIGTAQLLSVTINPSPTMTSANTATICSGDTLNIALTATLLSTDNWVASDNPNTVGESTTFQTSGTLNDIIINNSAAVQNVVYTTTPISILGGCLGTAQTITVTVNPLPSMTSANTATICSGSTPNILFTSDLVSDYSWLATDNSNTTGESLTQQNSGSLINLINNISSIPQNVTYSVVPTSLQGCVGNRQIIGVTVNPLPTMISASSFTLCNGGSTNITLSSDIGSTYSWLAADNTNTSGESTSLQTTNSINDVISNSTSNVQNVIYSVTPTSSIAGCSGNTQTVNVIVNPPVITTITANGGVTFCEGGNVTLTASSAASYLWSNAATTQSTTVNNSGNYSVTTINVSGCSAASSPVVVTAIPHNFNISITANPQFGNAPLFVAFNNTTPNRINYSYQWTFGDGTTSTSNAGTVFHQYSFNGLYDVSLVATSLATGCSDTLVLQGYINVINGTSCTHTATVTPSGTAFSCVGDSLILSCNSDTSFTYQWNINSTAISGANSNIIAVTQNGYYSVTILQAGCPVTSSATQAIFLPKPALPVITAYGFIVPCIGGSVTLVASATAGLNYLWNTSAINDSITVSNSGNYSVTVIDPSTGCGSTSAIYHLNASAAPAIPICLVTVDILSTHNILYWANQNNAAIDSFRVYREVATNIYSHIASVSRDSLSEYHDYGAYPNTTSYKYKISSLDTCGAESYLSEFHNTIHLQVLAGGNLQWTLYDIENQLNPVTYYVIERDTNNSGNFYPISSNVPGNNAFYSVVDYASYPNADYRAQVAWSISCTPTRATIITSRSNIRRSPVSTSINNFAENLITIYPNPSEGIFNVSCTLNQLVNVNVYNIVGECVYRSSINNRQSIIDLSNQSKGIYFVQMSDENKNVINKKIVIQ